MPQPADHRRRCPAIAALTLAAAWAADVALAQLSAADVAALRERGQRAGWTFQVSPNSATSRSTSELCGLREPADWRLGATFDDGPVLRDLPSAFDWRAQGGCTPVRDQGGCGSCWAFATVGALECNVLIRDGQSVDLSEQWLVSCNAAGYGCDGGWFAHQYHQATPDACGQSGAVLEAAFPYQAADLPCNCPYARAYTIDSWAFVGNGASVPAVAAIKQAIYTYGPVSVAVYVDGAFQAYGGGVFNASAPGVVNHAVLLVGWDDAQGAAGVWILRNSWGSGWGEDGYMRIEYDCSSVGYAACYVNYPGVNRARIEATPAALDFGQVQVGQTGALAVTVKNTGQDALLGSAVGLAAPFAVLGAADYNLAGGASTTINVRFAPTLPGGFADTLALSGGGGAQVAVSGVGVGAGAADQCAYAPTISDGVYAATNASADTEEASACGGGGTHDLWWRFVPPHAGRATIDTVGSDFDTVLSVYGSCGGAELICNDDAGGLHSQVSLSVSAAGSYWVRVAGVAGATGNVTLNVATAWAPHTISGRVTDADDAGVAGVTLAGLPASPVTDADGRYAATVEHGFSGVVSPTKTGWVFEPAERVCASVTSDRQSDNYVAEPVMLTIAGRITDGQGNALADVLVNGFPDPVATNADGCYAASVAYGFTGRAAPQALGYVFTPSSCAYSSLTADRPADDYVAALQTGALRVTLEPVEAADDGARWRVDGGVWQVSRATALGLSVGSHVVDFAGAAPWTAPGRQTVTVRPDETRDLTATYTLPDDASPGLTPTDANGGSADPLVDADNNHTPGLPLEVVPTGCGGGDTCGAGALPALPLTLLGICGLKRRR